MPVGCDHWQERLERREWRMLEDSEEGSSVKLRFPQSIINRVLEVRLLPAILRGVRVAYNNR
jgi:hypothetical protein